MTFYIQILKSQKNSRILKTKLKDVSNLEKSNNLYFPVNNIYSNLINSSEEYILKNIPENEYKFIKAEVEFLKLAKKKNFNLIVQLIADYDNGLKLMIILENCNTSLLDFLFEFKENIYFIKKKHLDDLKNYKTFLKNIINFFKKILIFFEQEEYVYCDWKFDNILVSYKVSNNIDDLEFKLTDFETVHKNMIEIKNENNINVIYSSPFLNKLMDTIQPSYFDDLKSVNYLLYALNDKQLPWTSIKPYNLKKEVIQESIFEITRLKLSTDIYYLNTEKLIYWPKQEFFLSFLNKTNFNH